MAEWLKAAVLKTAVGVSLPWVRIPLSPPEMLSNQLITLMFLWPSRGTSLAPSLATKFNRECSQAFATLKKYCGTYHCPRTNADTHCPPGSPLPKVLRLEPLPAADPAARRGSWLGTNYMALPTHLKS